MEHIVKFNAKSIANILDNLSDKYFRRNIPDIGKFLIQSGIKILEFILNYYIIDYYQKKMSLEEGKQSSLDYDG